MVSETSDSRNVVSYLDLLIDLVCSIFDKRDAFDFNIVIFLTYLGMFQQPQLMVHTSHS